MISKDLGTRHRAAIGITEDTDAISVVVSEETGLISFVEGGQIARGLDGPRLLAAIQAALGPSSSARTGGDAEKRDEPEALQAEVGGRRSEVS
jgi:diadenylate cyclase